MQRRSDRFVHDLHMALGHSKTERLPMRHPSDCPKGRPRSNGGAQLHHHPRRLRLQNLSNARDSVGQLALPHNTRSRHRIPLRPTSPSRSRTHHEGRTRRSSVARARRRRCGFWLARKRPVKQVTSYYRHLGPARPDVRLIGYTVLADCPS